MTVVVFTGPTISAGEARRHLDATYLPPAAQGDVFRVARERPTAIGLIDGYFQRVPAVFHKEILWAMREGIHVFGASSMGALRAAELAEFGMVGIGAIFEGYRSGEITDDDEVAVIHAGAEEEYRPQSEPMVNIRATIRAAAATGVIDDDVAMRLGELAKRTFYADRSFTRLVAEARRDASLADVDLDRLAMWLPGGHIDQKRLDAVAMLEAIAALAASSPAPMRVHYPFSHTTFFEDSCHRANRDRPLDRATPVRLDDMLTTAGLDPSFEFLRARAALRVLATWWAERWDMRVEGRAWNDGANRFWEERGVTDAEGAAAWMAAHDVDAAELERLVRAEAFRRLAEEDIRPELPGALLDELRLSGGYAAIRDRAHAHRALRDDVESELAAEPVEAAATDLLRWWFYDRFGVPVPDDLAGHARRSGFDGVPQLIRALERERQLAGTSAATGVRGIRREGRSSRRAGR